MKKLFFILSIQFLALQLSAHEAGHGSSIRSWQLRDSTSNLKADFVKKLGATVYLMSAKYELLEFNLADFSPPEQAYILAKSKWIAAQNTLRTKGFFALSYFIALICLVFSVLFFSRARTKKRTKFFTLSLIGLTFIYVGCRSSITARAIAANDISFLESVFGTFAKVKTRYDSKYFFIESDGLAEHEMMTGISNWQQQVPINHDYSGSNAWAIPLQPELAEKPLSTRENFMKGAIAIAANGIPIFNPLNNRGEDAKAIGELDKWGGHCGRADDYHYHLPPTHLQAKLGKGKPIAYALDGFPVYGETREELDENLGRFNADKSYQYHAIKEYPYLIAAMRGRVELNPRTRAPENEIIPQAKTRGVRAALKPLRGAKIINFEKSGPQQYKLQYEIGSLIYTIDYAWDKNGNYKYKFIDPDGAITSLDYRRK